MELTHFLSLPPQDAEELVTRLDSLLLDYQVYGEQVRRLHWDRKLRPWLNLTPKLNLLDRATQENTRLLAEQILSMGHTPSVPDVAFALVRSRVQPVLAQDNPSEAITSLIRSTRDLLEQVHEVWQLANSLQEPSTMQVLGGLSMQLRFVIQVFQGSRSVMNN